MAKLKNVLLMALSFALVAALAIGGTVAYLTSTDSAVNVMTVGNVKIEQQEWQRAEGVSHINAGAKEGDLVPFVQEQSILPAVPKNNAATDYSAEQADDRQFWWGYYTNGNGSNGLWDDDKLSNVIDKIVMVKNTGKSDAYYRTIIAIECPEGITIGEPAQGAEIMINTNGNTRFDWEDAGYITVNDVRYALLVAQYNEVLAPNEVSRPSLLQLVLTHNATNEDMELLGNTLDVLVLSQAVQAAGFDGAATALDTAFGKVADKAAEWFGEVTAPAPAPAPVPDPVSSADELETAISKGGNFVLTDDITLTETLFANNDDVVIDLNGKTITAPSSGTMFHSGSDTDPSITITSSVAGAEINVSGGDTAVLLGYGSTVISNVTINVTGCDNYSPSPFNVYGDLTLGEGTVVNIDYLGSSLIDNNGKVAISIDGAEINIGTFKKNGLMITLNNATTFEMKNTTMKIDNFVLSQFGGEGLIKITDGVTIENCTFDVTDSNGASCTFVADAGLGRYDLVQK